MCMKSRNGFDPSDFSVDIFGIDAAIEWMVHITVADEVSREKKEYYTFFKTRAEADAYVTGLVNNMMERNIVIRVVKVKCFDGDDKSFDPINSCTKGCY